MLATSSRLFFGNGQKSEERLLLSDGQACKKIFFYLTKAWIIKTIIKSVNLLAPSPDWLLEMGKIYGQLFPAGPVLSLGQSTHFYRSGPKSGPSFAFLSHTCSRPTSLAVCIQTLQTMQGTEQFSVRNVIKELLLLVDKNTGKIHFLSTLISSSFFVHAFTFPRSAPCNLSSTHAFPRTPFWYTAMRLVILTHSYTSLACNMWRKGIVIYYCLIIYFITLFIVYLLHLKLDTPRNAYLSTHIHAHPYASTYIFYWIWNNTY